MLKIILFLNFFVFPLFAKENCVVANPDDCPKHQVCAKYNSKGDSKCFQVPEHAPLVFDLPFDSKTKVICAQSGRFSSASHIFRNMLYAIDLATPYANTPSTVRASADGKAFVFNECKEPGGNPEQTKTDNCGSGYGNHIRILHKDGYISIHAHLSEISVKSGEFVRRHQKIGVEGATGYAAYRHLHWDIHKLQGSKESWEKSLLLPAYDGVSVPFYFNISINGTNKKVDSSTIACRWLDMNQPAWSGVGTDSK